MPMRSWIRSLLTRPSPRLSLAGTKGRRIRLWAEELEPRYVPSTLTPAQVRHAYGFDQPTALTGSGQTIAIVTAYDDPNIASDLAAFSSAYGITGGAFIKVPPPGAHPKSDPGWALETSLDVEWAHAIAPGATILLVEAASNSYSNLLAAVDYAAAYTAPGVPPVSVVSMSWGSAEFSGETSLDGHFVHAGVTFVTASGDTGAPASWPSSSPNVLSVGGTTLTVGGAGNWLSEIGWGGSGGGTSGYENKPSYQADYGIGGTKRSTPDVAYNADPNTGVAVYDTVRYQGHTGWWSVGGTSAGAPQWAALVAIANQGRHDTGLAPLDGASTLAALYKMGAEQYTVGGSTYFYDITSGNNGTQARTAYDQVTGLGSPNVDGTNANLVVQGLVQATVAGGAVTITANGITHVDGSVQPRTIVVTTVVSPGAFLLPANNTVAAAPGSVVVPTLGATTDGRFLVPAVTPAAQLTMTVPGMLSPNRAEVRGGETRPGLSDDSWPEGVPWQNGAGDVVPNQQPLLMLPDVLPRDEALAPAAGEAWTTDRVDQSTAPAALPEAAALPEQTLAALAAVVLGMSGYRGDRREERERRQRPRAV